MKSGMRSGIAVLALMQSIPAWADQFHYNNVILGDRAMGLAGAYAGVSDDASGVFYNPGGLGFALSNDISGSANAFYKKQATYKKTIGSEDFTENSAGSLAPFFGGLQKLDNISPGLVFAFGIFSRDSELRDQDDTIIASNLGIERFHRAVNLRAATTGMGGAVAKRITNSFSVGLGLAWLSVDELTQEYQDVVSRVDDGTTGSYKTTTTTSGQESYIYRILTQNIRQRLTSSAIEPSLGFQWAASQKLSFGANFKFPQAMSQNFENNIEQTSAYVDGELTVVRDSNHVEEGTGKLGRVLVDSEVEEPIEWASEMRFGMAYFHSQRLLWTFDVTQHGETKGDVPQYDREAVTNFQSGMEYYITPSVPVRVGAFTNNDARPQLSKSKLNQRDHVDYTGMSLFFAWVQPNSQVALGSIVQMGKGEAQKISNSPKIQDVEAFATTVAFSATHSF